jgi:hypothetical protein
MPVTPEDIANMALALLDDAPIASLDDDNRAARLLNTHYDVTRQAELMKHSWAFAVMTAELAGTDTGSGDGTLNWAYDLPPDCLKVLPLTYDGEYGGIPISWQVKNGQLFTDQESPRKITYIGNLVDPDDWDATFTEVLAAALAIKVAHPITKKAGMIEICQRAYDRALKDALAVNAVQRWGTLYRQSWSTARGDTRFWRA